MRKTSLAQWTAFLVGLFQLCNGVPSTAEDWTKSKAGKQQELRFDVPPGAVQCFFVPLLENQNIHIAFEVLRGADRNIDMVVHAPDGHVIDQRLWAPNGQIEALAVYPGDFSICFDNGFSRFTAKLIYLYIMVWEVNAWEQHARELADYAVSMQNVTTSLQFIDNSVQTARRHIALARSRAATDQYSLLDNSSHVQNLSITMCLVIMATSGFQVVFVKRLFNVQAKTPTAKPRA